MLYLFFFVKWTSYQACADWLKDICQNPIRPLAETAVEIVMANLSCFHIFSRSSKLPLVLLVQHYNFMETRKALSIS